MIEQLKILELIIGLLSAGILIGSWWIRSTITSQIIDVLDKRYVQQDVFDEHLRIIDRLEKSQYHMMEQVEKITNMVNQLEFKVTTSCKYERNE